MTLRSALAWLLLSASVLGCASQPYEYRAMENRLSTVGDEQGALYPIPSPDEAKGHVRVLSLGVVDLGSKKKMPNVRALHMRMALDNTESINTWTLNTREQRVSFPDEGESRAAYLNTDTGRKELPKIQVHPGADKVVDLYYPLPPGLKSASEIPAFQFHWELQAGDRKITQTTQFDRFNPSARLWAVNPLFRAPGTTPFGPGWGETWWFDREYARWTWKNPTPVYPIP